MIQNKQVLSIGVGKKSLTVYIQHLASSCFSCLLKETSTKPFPRVFVFIYLLYMYKCFYCINIYLCKSLSDYILACSHIISYLSVYSVYGPPRTFEPTLPLNKARVCVLVCACHCAVVHVYVSVCVSVCTPLGALWALEMSDQI